MTDVENDQIEATEATTPEADVKATKPKRKRKAKAKTKKTSTPRVRGLPREHDVYGFVIGSLKSKAAEMAASETGFTLAEGKKALGSIQFNWITELRGKGYQFDEVLEDSPEGKRKTTRYFLKPKAEPQIQEEAA